jgi:hypothetical protein
MLGKSAGHRALAIVSRLGLVLVLATCAKMVPQDKATGEDGKVKGAKAITLDGGKGKSSGIVTYPGGDRVDWKVIELPQDKVGELRLKLSWIPPRPGLGLGLDVFDQHGKLVESERGGKKKSVRKTLRTSLMPAKGKYWVRVYAKNRGDAGKYTLRVEFDESMGPAGVEIPDPPRLPAVPEAEVPCDELSFDKKNPACRSVCPNPPDPNWPACKGVCPNLPVGDANNPACWPKMDCPAVPDRRIKACFDKFPPCNPAAKDPQNPKCDNYKAPPVKGKVINVQASSDGVIITINKGEDKQVEKGWTGKILRKDNGKPMNNGDFVISRVGKRESVGKVKGLTADQVSANRDVLLEAP